MNSVAHPALGCQTGRFWGWGHFDMNHRSLPSFIWSVADLLRGDYKQSDYGKVILPFTVLRRLDCVLEATKPKVLAEFAAKTKQKVNPDPFLLAPPVRASTTHRRWTWAS
jgi:type I restriction-modification system DNA methylase subunit